MNLSFMNALKMSKEIKEKYPNGTRVRMISMGNDPHPIEPNTCGTVTEVDDIGTIHVRWDNGRTLGVCLDEDEIEII